MDAAVGSAAKAAPRRTRSKVGGLVDEAGVGYVPSGHHGDVKRQPGVLSLQASAYCAMIPPSTARISPARHAAPSDARWSPAWAISAGLPSRPSRTRPPTALPTARSGCLDSNSGASVTL